MPVGNLKPQILRLPEQPGVYLFLNEAAETIYVGKARSLRDRVRSYLGARGSSPKTDRLLDEAASLQTIVTDSVVEALALENNLIKQRRPRYNILLRDDKNYPYLQLTTGEAFPRVLVARQVARDGHFYAGPYMPASLARRTMSLTHRLFGIRSCNEEITGRRGRPCLEYDIKRCIAPCVASLCGPERYAEAVTATTLFLEGRNEELTAQLQTRMTLAAEAERFEEAAQLRDALRTVETLRGRQQKMATVGLGARDAVGVKLGPAGAAIQVFQVRRGRVIERVDLSTDTVAGAMVVAEGAGMAVAAPEADSGEVLQAALEQFYQDHEAPPEIHVPTELPESTALEDWLTAREGRRVRVVVPRRGERRALVDLAMRNAALAYQSRFDPDAGAAYDALDTLRALLNLPGLPRRVEGFDISTIQGSETVASMVVCEDGRMRKGEYRNFRIGPAASGSGPDDFAAMREVVQRRYRRVLAHGGPFPDLILIDGGRGQVSAAYDALESLGLGRMTAIGLAKQEELIVLRDSPDPIALPASNPALRMLQQVRDEAHRFAVTFHRKARTGRDLRSALDEVAGIGPRRRKALLSAFGSVAGVRRASREELTAVVGAKAADAVLAHFARP